MINPPVDTSPSRGRRSDDSGPIADKLTAVGANTWEAISLHGKTLDLIDVTRVQTLRFDAAGQVAVTIGTRGGPVAGPVWFWRIDDGTLVISDEPGAEGRIVLPAPRVVGTILSTRDATGGSIQYQMSAAP
jgi:hypothetical protein